MLDTLKNIQVDTSRILEWLTSLPADVEAGDMRNTGRCVMARYFKADPLYSEFIGELRMFMRGFEHGGAFYEIAPPAAKDFVANFISHLFHDIVDYSLVTKKEALVCFKAAEREGIRAPLS